MKKELNVMYVMRDILHRIKDEMDRRQMSFDELLAYWDEATELLENSNREESAAV